MAIAERLGYEANPLLSALMSQRRRPTEKRNGPTLGQIAAVAKCSTAAVSLALRNSPRISSSTRERIAGIAAALEYRPDPFESARVAQRQTVRVQLQCSTTIAFLNLFHDISLWRATPSFTRFFAGAETRATELGLRLEEFRLAARGMTGRKMTEILRASGIQGIIIGSAERPRAHVSLDWKWFSVVAQAQSVVAPRVSRVTTDYAQCLELAFRKLRHLGYERIGLYLPPDLDLRCRGGWSSNFLGQQRKQLAARRIPILDYRHGAEKEFARWFRKHRPEAVLTIAGMERELAAASLEVPDDLALINLTGNPGHPHEPNNLVGRSGLDLHQERIGRVAVEMLFSQLITNQRGIPDSPVTALVEGTWVDGNTVRNLGRIVSPAAAVDGILRRHPLGLPNFASGKSGEA
jgi:LacI family transcriptional regulator